MEKNTLYTLPTKEKMLENLLTVSQDDNLQQNFFPLLLLYAGEIMSACDVYRKIESAIYEYCRSSSLTTEIKMTETIPVYIKALLLNEEGRKEALTLFNEEYSDPEKDLFEEDDSEGDESWMYIDYNSCYFYDDKGNRLKKISK